MFNCVTVGDTLFLFFNYHPNNLAMYTTVVVAVDTIINVPQSDTCALTYRYIECLFMLVLKLLLDKWLGTLLYSK